MLRCARTSATRSLPSLRVPRSGRVTGAGTSFCAGADLPAVFGDSSSSVAQIRRDLHAVYDGFLRVRAPPIPTIAA